LVVATKISISGVSGSVQSLSAESINSSQSSSTLLVQISVEGMQIPEISLNLFSFN